MSRHLEEYVSDTIAFLRENLPTKLTEINDEKADGLDLAVPEDTGGAVGTPGVSYSAGDQDILAYPWIEVAAPDWMLDSVSLSQYVADFSPVIVVRAMYQAFDRVPLRKAVHRYSRALLEVLMGPGAFGEGESLTSARGSNRFNPETNERDELYGACLLVFTLNGVQQ